MRGIAAAVAAGLVTGVVSRLVDTAAWAPDWLGYVFTPWLATAWLAGALSSSTRSGALKGLAMLLAVVAAYLAWSMTSSVPVPAFAAALYGLAALGGPIFGAAGATWRGRGRWAAAGGALFGGAVVLESLALQLAVHSTPERLVLAGDSLAGIGLTLWLVRRPCAGAVSDAHTVSGTTSWPI